MTVLLWLTRFLDNAAESGRTVICVGSGNEGAAGGHFSARLLEGEEQTAELVVGEMRKDAEHPALERLCG